MPEAAQRAQRSQQPGRPAPWAAAARTAVPATRIAAHLAQLVADQWLLSKLRVTTSMHCLLPHLDTDSIRFAAL